MRTGREKCLEHPTTLTVRLYTLSALNMMFGYSLCVALAIFVGTNANAFSVSPVHRRNVALKDGSVHNHREAAPPNVVVTREKARMNRVKKVAIPAASLIWSV
jgi:hypothetical protein